MKLSNTILFIALLLVSGCSISNKQQYEGYFTYGSEVSDFRSCGTNETFWLNGEQKQMEIIEQASLAKAQKVGEPYQEIYVLFSGFPENRKAVGFEEETVGLIYMTELIKSSNQTKEGCQ
ncbi:hypothetical protein EWS92_22605 [Vibrio vulnificus]|uniref:hypothetical protein n=1 Tax=Vibrio vulnificus TaxID=672 RepID=UPI0007EE7888|nr:hypothetical protein [Vibrio vulnificus]ANN29696.1 hypothetical protein FORC17_p052 [Vibrio vulnificus]EGR0791226.1 hypothetical protein [Vibrio vulnificus]EGR0799767.1 hypothetical protein [Vibrio vulnificus]EGR0817020.1 hypothetical protein [Vibrio vulnificus]EGR0879911.1 hypothetical protein [Vibrio vulnificus]